MKIFRFKSTRCWYFSLGEILHRDSSTYSEQPASLNSTEHLYVEEIFCCAAAPAASLAPYGLQILGVHKKNKAYGATTLCLQLNHSQMA